jgi:outer membrane biosynthesis protein TonB
MAAPTGTIIKGGACACHWRLIGVGLPKGQQREGRHPYPEIAHATKLAISLRMSGACICTGLHIFMSGMRIVVIGAFLALGALLSAQTEKKPAQPAQAAPARQPGKPAAQPAQPAQPATAAEPAQPAKPSATPAQPAQPAHPPHHPEHHRHTQPAQPAPPPHHPEHHQHAPHKSDP